VAQAGVTGVPDPEKGEIIVAFVLPVEGAVIDPGELEGHCKALSSRYKVPDRIFIATALPTTVTGKIMRRQLREQAIASIPRKA
jgi:acyl-coenzyme A synthetase/AMP-(fatty) acid ligase